MNWIELMNTLRSRRWRPLGWLLVATSLTACGGGGGGGVDNNASQPEVRVYLNATQITAEVMPTGMMPNVTLKGGATGNLASLNGKTVYVIVEDPASLFESPATFGPYSDGSIEIALRGRQMTASGTLAGELAVHACFDPACKSELSGSPMRVPYNVKVARGLSVDAETVNVSTTFGDPAATRSLTVNLPEHLRSWAARNTTPYNPNQPSVVTVDATTAAVDAATGTITLKVLPALPGSRRETVTVTATAELDGLSYTYTKDIVIDSVVSDNPAIDYVFTPARLDMTFTYGDPLNHETYYSFIAKPGISLTWRGVEYLSNPPAANGHRQVNDWFADYYYSHSATPCYSTISSSDCMPVGTYTARVHYTMTKGGADGEVYYPVVLQIVP